MNDPRHQLTPEVQERICALVRAGGFPHVAAVAAGIPVKTFNSWMRWGGAKRPVPRYRDFREAVEQAHAMARLVAEGEALRRAPLSWLRFGPGRETGKLPGWTDAVKPARQEKRIGMSVTHLRELIPVMLEALDAFPDARAALSASLDKLAWLKDDCPEEPPAAEAKPVAAPTDEPAPAKEEAPSATIERSLATAPEPATQPQASDNETVTKAQPTDNETATKTQPNASENAVSEPPPQPESKPAPRKKRFDINMGLPDSAWTVVWRSWE